MEKREIQQGDCILVKVSSIPKSAKKVKFDGVVLRGEGTNTHEVVASEVEVYEQDGTMFLKVDKKTNLVHQEHGTQVINPGIYKRVIEREFDYESEEARNTQD